MTRLALLALMLSTAAVWTFAPAAPEREAVQVKLNGHTFTLPPGFTVELVAGPPLVNRPIVADFDEQGRLYVADSSGTNDKVKDQLEKKPHRIVRLEDTDGDGRFDKSTVFADKMMFPEGAMWLNGSLYVAAAPSIWKLTDTNNDGVADQREEWFKGKTLTGCANDLHGPYRGPDAHCGATRYESGAFGKEYQDNLFACAFNLHKVMRFVLEPDGATYKTRDSDFLMSDNNDFHPTDVIEAADGSLLVVDTGGW